MSAPDRRRRRHVLGAAASLGLLGLPGCAGLGRGGTPASGAAAASADGATVRAAGSSTVAALLKELAEAHAAGNRGTAFDISGAGSSTALPALLADRDVLGLLSRPLAADERAALVAARGRPPLELKIALDAVGVFAFKANPVRALTLAQLRRAFGRGPDAAQRWGELDAGLPAPWAGRALVRFGLERGRGAYELFRDLVLAGGDFAGDVAAEPVSTSVVQGVGTEPGGLGYASVFFQTRRTRLVAIEHRGEAVEPTAASVAAGRYPLARYLHVIAGGDASPPARAFLRFVLSADGQAIVTRQGFYALDAATAADGAQRLGG